MLIAPSVNLSARARDLGWGQAQMIQAHYIHHFFFIVVSYKTSKCPCSESKKYGRVILTIINFVMLHPMTLILF